MQIHEYIYCDYFFKTFAKFKNSFVKINLFAPTDATEYLKKMFEIYVKIKSGQFEIFVNANLPRKYTVMFVCM